MYTALSIAATAITIITCTVFLACTLARLTGRKPDDNGLRFESQIQHRQRPQ